MTEEAFRQEVEETIWEYSIAGTSVQEFLSDPGLLAKWGLTECGNEMFFRAVFPGTQSLFFEDNGMVYDAKGDYVTDQRYYEMSLGELLSQAECIDLIDPPIEISDDNDSDIDVSPEMYEGIASLGHYILRNFKSLRNEIMGYRKLKGAFNNYMDAIVAMNKIEMLSNYYEYDLNTRKKFFEFKLNNLEIFMSEDQLAHEYSHSDDFGIEKLSKNFDEIDLKLYIMKIVKHMSDQNTIIKEGKWHRNPLYEGYWYYNPNSRLAVFCQEVASGKLKFHVGLKLGPKQFSSLIAIGHVW